MAFELGKKKSRWIRRDMMEEMKSKRGTRKRWHSNSIDGTEGKEESEESKKLVEGSAGTRRDNSQ